MPRWSVAIAGALVAAILAACATTTSDPTSEVSTGTVGQSGKSSPSRSMDTDGPLDEKAVVSVSGVPFEIAIPGLTEADAHLYSEGVLVISADDAVAPGELHQLSSTGRTATGDEGRPGPSIRAVLSGTEAFAGLMQPEPGGDFTDLSQLPTILGLVGADGAFVELPNLTQDVELLAGSNPEVLYFEPQDATSFREWVVWREGSAGQSGALPTIDADDWRVMGWNRETGVVQEYASAYLLHGDRFAPRSSNHSVPTTDGESIYFSAEMPAALVEGDDPLGVTDMWTTAVLRVPLDAPGQIAVLGRGELPVADKRTRGVYWVEGVSVVDDGQPLLELATPGWSIGALAVTEQMLVVGVVSHEDEAAWLLVWDLERERPAYAVRSTGNWVVPDAYGETVVWGNGSSNSDPEMFLWRVRDPAVTALGAVDGFSLPKFAEDLLAVPTLTAEGAIIWSLFRVE